MDAAISPYLGTYNTLLSGLFMDHPPDFMVYFDKETDALTVVVRTTRTTWKPAFFCLVVPKHESTANDSTMARLLQGVEVAPIEVVHGMCVSGCKAWFYKFGCTCHASQHAEFDLGEEQGARYFVEVVEDVKSMCRKSIGDLPELREEDFL